MGWLSQNWIWLALGLGALFMMRRGRFGHYAGGHAGHGRGAQPARSATSNTRDVSIDPVNGEPVRTDKALTSLYQGKIYYFASKENRDRFEAAPQEYAQKAAGHPVGPVEAANERPRRRHGC